MMTGKNLTILFILYMAINLIGCGKLSKTTQVIKGSPNEELANTLANERGFGCTVEFDVSSALVDEEFQITVRPTGSFLNAPTRLGTPSFTTIVSSSSTDNVLKVKAKMKFSGVFRFQVSDKRGRTTTCAGAITIQE